MGQYIPTEQLVLAPWDKIVRQLAGRGWASIPAAIRPPLLAQLAASTPARSDWAPADFGLAPEPVQRLALSQAPPLVQDLSLRLAASLSVAAELQGLPTMPLFGEVAWLCSPGQAGIRPSWASAGIDVGVSAIVCLYGMAVVRTLVDGRRHPSAGQVELSNGGLALLRGDGWLGPARRGVRAHVESPHPAPGLIMVLIG